MNTIFGIGFSELVVIFILVIVLIGPERTKETAQKAGKALGKILRSQWWADFQMIQKNIRDLPNTLVRMAEIEEIQNDLKQSLDTIQNNINAETKEISDEINKLNDQIQETHTILSPEHPSNSDQNSGEKHHG
jgi:sec-independent protein translocase protein TatB